MRNVWTLALGVLLGGASLVPAQTFAPSNLMSPTSAPSGTMIFSPTSAPPGTVILTPTSAPSAPVLPAAAAGPASTRIEPHAEPSPAEGYSHAGGNDRDNASFWVNAEYLLWWVKGGPTPPLATTGDPNGILTPGAIAVGNSATRILFGGTALDFSDLSGVRLSAGAWLDSDRSFGVEASGFKLFQKTVSFSAAANAGGNPPIYVPAYLPNRGIEGSFTIADPVAGFTGSLAIAAHTELWGSEINGLASVVRRDGFQLNALAGVRYLDLHESIGLSAPNLFDFVNNINETHVDAFNTRNVFCGAQIGAKLAYCFGIVSAEVTAKFAFGDNHENITVQGTSTQSGPGATNPGTFLGGILAQPTNIGARSHDELTVIPELTFQAGCNVLENLRVFVSYNFLYWNSVVRPGAEIDHNVNPTQIFGMPLAGPAAPVPQYNRTDFWAQGVSCGLELRF
jgi:hypothetical protein